MLKIVPMVVVLVAGIPLAAATGGPEGSFAEIHGAVEDLAAQIREAGPRRVAVVDLVDLRGNVLELGRALAEEISSVLVREGGPLQVVDRMSLGALLREHDLQVTGLVDPETTKELGKISGVEVLVTGALTPLGEKVHVTLKAIDTETATVVASTTVDLRQTVAIDRLLQLGVPRRNPRPGTSSRAQGDYQGTAKFEKLGALDVQLVSLEVLNDGDLTLALSVRNTRAAGESVGVAWKAQGSGGIADYWKFTPRPTASVTSRDGERARCREASGLGFARTSEDWSVLEPTETTEATLKCDGPRSFYGATSFNVRIELWVYDGESRRREAESVQFRDVRPVK